MSNISAPVPPAASSQPDSPPSAPSPAAPPPAGGKRPRIRRPVLILAIAVLALITVALTWKWFYEGPSRKEREIVSSVLRDYISGKPVNGQRISKEFLAKNGNSYAQIKVQTGHTRETYEGTSIESIGLIKLDNSNQYDYSIKLVRRGELWVIASISIRDAYQRE